MTTGKSGIGRHAARRSRNRISSHKPHTKGRGWQPNTRGAVENFNNLFRPRCCGRRYHLFLCLRAMFLLVSLGNMNGTGLWHMGSVELTQTKIAACCVKLMVSGKACNG